MGLSLIHISPRIVFQLTDFGFRYAAIRKPILNPTTSDYIRITLFVAPFTVLIPPNDQYKLAQMLFPIDDENTMFYCCLLYTSNSPIAISIGSTSTAITRTRPCSTISKPGRRR